jgi:hypothetical protein
MPVEAPSPYRTVSAAAVFAQAALGAIAVGSVLLTWAHLQRRQAAIEFGERFDLASATALDDAETVVGLLSIGYVLAFIGAAIAIPILCFRIHANLHGPLQARGLEYRPGWAAGWWFVPLANLVMPYRVVKEAWRASDPSIPAGTTTWRSTDPPKLLSWWWAGFVISGLIGRFSYTELDADGNVTASSVEFSATVAAFGSALTVVAALLAIMVFRQVTQRHLARARMLGIAE